MQLPESLSLAVYFPQSPFNTVCFPSCRIINCLHYSIELLWTNPFCLQAIMLLLFTPCWFGSSITRDSGNLSTSHQSARRWEPCIVYISTDRRTHNWGKMLCILFEWRADAFHIQTRRSNEGKTGGKIPAGLECVFTALKSCSRQFLLRLSDEANSPLSLSSSST